MTLPDVLPGTFSRIVERLAGPGWAVCPEFLDLQTLTRLAAEARQLWQEGEFRHARVGIGASRQLRPEIRSDRVLWLDPSQASPALADYFSRLEQLRLALNETLFLGLFGFEAHLTVYPAGSFYRRHLDQFRGAGHRIVSCILYLNDDWSASDGGQLRLYLPDNGGSVDVLPEGGKLVVFLSESMEHEVLPASRERFSLTGWLRLRGANPLRSGVPSA
jgi:SM-20-related protein